MNIRSTHILSRHHKVQDVEMHTLLTEVEGVFAVEFRDFIISSGEYGRGYWMPLDLALVHLTQVAAAVSEEVEA